MQNAFLSTLTFQSGYNEVVYVFLVESLFLVSLLCIWNLLGLMLFVSTFHNCGGILRGYIFHLFRLYRLAQK